ncbi:response regulator receiver protein [Candidatus Nitrosarchaeum limnium SFB1]|jgi:CheY-like chemotaxis protein|uniref:Response regulator receiver protein n=1 Tax=Candidatus Nitrosarchaeum limnium SFB1 TaxID=886738 RepID=F3KKV5_9ARCH|nr:response regulator receiver protein [Candidatus Nitrosarchaeum limnium SFB1]
MITCIVIDDDLNTTKVFSDLLELMGLDVLAIGHDGNDAISLYMKYRPELVFTDIMMPNTDGFYGIKKIREFDPNAKIVAVTADVSEETEKQLRELRITAIICKPFDQREIKQVLLEKYKINT